MMNCYFCNSVLNDTAPAGSLKDIYLIYVCNNCQPHDIIYRKLYDEDTKELITDAIRIDEYMVIRNYQKNTTEFNKTVRNNIVVNVNGFLVVDGIWEIPSCDIEVVKQKLNLYAVFS